MLLSEKITELRKRQGLSQEEFGAEIGVSRQAVSKWEMAQTTPDLSKIMVMSEFFGVSTDFLLKDEYDLSYLNNMSSENAVVSAEVICGSRLLRCKEKDCKKLCDSYIPFRPFSISWNYNVSN